MFLNKKSICITLIMVIFACVCISAVSANTNITSDNSQDNVTDLENNSIDLVKESERNLTIIDFVPYESDPICTTACTLLPDGRTVPVTYNKTIWDQCCKELEEMNRAQGLYTAENGKLMPLYPAPGEFWKWDPIMLEYVEMTQREKQIKMGDMTDLYIIDAETGTYIPLGDVTKPLPEEYRYKGDLKPDIDFKIKDLNPSMIMSYDYIVR